MNSLADRLHRLDRLLSRCAGWWRPQPFKRTPPPWCRQQPQLCEQLLSLEKGQLDALGRDNEALMAWLQPWIPELAELSQLSVLPACTTISLQGLGPHFHSGIPGRKWRQITHFTAAVGPVRQPLLEWCGGKGHLGRFMAAQWGEPVLTVEHQSALCEAGEHYAQRAGVVQTFSCSDALSIQDDDLFTGRHAVALHACGELHRRLIEQALAAQLDAFDIAPCCYHLGAAEHYRPFSSGLSLQLSRDDLRLAVTETATAAGREVALRDREMAWKLGFDQLRRERCGVSEYRPIKPIDKHWLRDDFSGFCRRLAQREGMALPAQLDWSCYETEGWRRQGEVMRYSLVRAAFRRALELWLVLDMAAYIEAHGYAAELATFCGRELTPRNILISARRKAQSS